MADRFAPPFAAGAPELLFGPACLFLIVRVLEGAIVTIVAQWTIVAEMAVGSLLAPQKFLDLSVLISFAEGR